MTLFTKNLASTSTLNVGMAFVPDKLNHLGIHSIFEYIIFDDLLRPLVKLDCNGEIIADIILKWEIKNKHKKFIFTLKENQFFSAQYQRQSRKNDCFSRHLWIHNRR